MLDVPSLGLVSGTYWPDQVGQRTWPNSSSCPEMMHQCSARGGDKHRQRGLHGACPVIGGRYIALCAARRLPPSQHPKGGTHLQPRFLQTGRPANEKSLPPFLYFRGRQLDHGWSYWPEILAPGLKLIFTTFSNYYHLFFFVSARFFLSHYHLYQPYT